MSRLPRCSLIFFFGLAVGACATGNSTPAMHIPYTSLPPFNNHASSTSPFDNSEQASFRLARIVVALKRGAVIAHYLGRNGNKWRRVDFCNHRFGRNAKLEWGSGKAELGNWSSEFGQIFFDAMNSRGANVVGDSTKLFRVRENAKAAEYLIGGRITGISGNFCAMHSSWNGVPLGRSYGELSVAVEWELFSALTRQVVYKFSTQGYAETRKGRSDVFSKTFSTAFANAVETAAEDDGFKKFLERKPSRTVKAPPSHERFSVTGRSLYRKTIRSHVGNVRSAAVTIELGNGHGSGFLISRDGYVLTNAHVVGEGKNVPVVFTNGLRISGRVLRVAKNRDVALVKVPIIADHILPISQKKPPIVLDTVYALGTPLKRGLQATLTKGVVSAHRKLRNEPYIQADVAITGGNSGGPLLDESGNVVGITVASFVRGQNLNLFIPIDDALKALNLDIVVE